MFDRNAAAAAATEIEPKLIRTAYQGDIGAGTTVLTRPIDYRPEVASPDRWSLAFNMARQIEYWRMFAKMDPIVGPVIEMYSEMGLSDYTVEGEGVDGEAKQLFEDCLDEIQVVSLLASSMKEHLVVGEAIPHLFYDPTKGYWTDWSLHRQELVEVIDTQIVGMEPILRFKPSKEDIDSLRKLATINEKLGVSFPGKAFADEVLSKREVILEPLNVTYIPRLSHPYDARGTSIMTRLWRTFMYEDAVYNACLAEGTPISVASGAVKPIEDVEVGDAVIDRDGNPSKVVDAWEEPPVDEQVVIAWTGSDGRRRTLQCTARHRFPVVRDGVPLRMEARHIRTGDALTTPVGGRPVVDSVATVPVDARARVFNLTVEGDHSYVANGVGTYNSIQTAKRHAAPIKVVKMGDLANGYIASREQEDHLIRALVDAELDPMGWVLAPPGTTFEAWGTTDKALNIRNDAENIERAKLVALGVSKDFLTGSATFASAQSSLQVFLSRLLSFRIFMERVFVYPKIFGPLIKVHNMRMPTRADAAHGVRTTRKSGDPYIKPRIRWSKSLAPRSDEEQLKTYKMLVKDFEMRLSQRTISEAAGVDWETEQRRTLEEDSLKSILEGTPSSSGHGGGGDIDLGGPTVLGEEDGAGMEGIEGNVPELEVDMDGSGASGMHAESSRRLAEHKELLDQIARRARRGAEVSDFLAGGKRASGNSPYMNVTKAQTARRLRAGASEIDTKDVPRGVDMADLGVYVNMADIAARHAAVSARNAAGDGQVEPQERKRRKRK